MTDQGSALVIEADQSGVESGVPQGRQKQAVVDVQALSVAHALRPRDDVRRFEQRGIAEPGDRAAPRRRPGIKLIMSV
jgi:hypothetical protein